MKQLSDAEVEELVHGGILLAQGGPGSGKRNGFSEEEWDLILDGNSKMLTETEDFPHMTMVTFKQYASRELCIRAAADPNYQRPVVRRHISDQRAVIIDYRKR